MSLNELRDALEDAAAELRGDKAPPRNRPTLERPPKADFGDYSSNAAMLLAPVLGEKPRDVAVRLGEAVSGRLADKVARVDVAGPGFLNLFLTDVWYADALAATLADGFGGGGASMRERVNVEFVSANPTGPLHLGHARNAAYGDSVARLLEFHGHDVAREYYINDAGVQMANFGLALQARARGEVPAEYPGEYILDIVGQIPGATELRPEELAERGKEIVLAGMKETLARFRVEPFDVWFSEKSLYEGDPPKVQHGIDELDKQGATYHHEDALWLRAEQFGDDKDRVLIKSDGTYTYLAPDIAYHQDKRERGFDRIIDVWGADHHGYVQRMRAAFGALGGDVDRFELLIMQFVGLVRGGESVSMGKRAGNLIMLDELIDELGTDVARWFLLSRSHDTAIDVDLDLAKQEAKENPAHYVRYAHARMSKLLRDADGEPDPALAHPLQPRERALIKRLVAFPAEVSEAADRRAPHRIATYALDLARDYTLFYEDRACKILGSEQQAFRLALCDSSRRAIARSLDLLGIQAPESM
ncbi:MAG: arginyl-tRNA synthetase [Solirubrobacteraceae bacterium]|jgi:arginyl-tRNA synthetase|nr:arginyl-tRNA synthetase [Solirubrobacteraceae bacterium]